MEQHTAIAAAPATNTKQDSSVQADFLLRKQDFSLRTLTDLKDQLFRFAEQAKSQVVNLGNKEMASIEASFRYLADTIKLPQASDNSKLPDPESIFIEVNGYIKSVRDKKGFWGFSYNEGNRTWLTDTVLKNLEYRQREYQKEIAVMEHRKGKTYDGLEAVEARIATLEQQLATSDRQLVTTQGNEQSLVLALQFLGKRNKGFVKELQAELQQQPEENNPLHHAVKVMAMAAFQEERERAKQKAAQWIGEAKFPVVEHLVNYHEKTDSAFEKEIIKFIIFQLLFHKNKKTTPEIISDTHALLSQHQFSTAQCPQLTEALMQCAGQLALNDKASKAPVTAPEWKVYAQIVWLDKKEKGLYLPEDENAHNVFAFHYGNLHDGTMIPENGTEKFYRETFLRKLKSLTQTDSFKAAGAAGLHKPADSAVPAENGTASTNGHNNNNNNTVLTH